MTRFSRWSALWASFYSADLYRDVIARWKGIGVLYLLLLLSICWLPTAVRWFSGLREFAATRAPDLVRQLPTITIEQGVMRATPSGRHVVTLEPDAGGRNGLTVIIDDTVDTTPNEITGEAFVLTRREAAAIRPRRGERRVWALGPGADTTLPPRRVGAFFDALPYWMAPIGYVGAVAGSLVMRLLQALAYGGMAVAYAQKRRLALAYGSAVSLAAVAMTPVVVVRTLIGIGFGEPAWYWRWPVAMLVTLAYITFGIRAAASAHDDAGRPSLPTA